MVVPIVKIEKISITIPEEDEVGGKNLDLMYDRVLIYPDRVRNLYFTFLFVLRVLTKLWQGQNGPELKLQIQKQFSNISALMDYVGCEKCRLWGKLQVLGLGTTLKILFSVDHGSDVNQPLQLQRNEVIALVNPLNRLSESVKYVQEVSPSTEKKMEGLLAEPLAKEISLRRLWEAVGGSWHVITFCFMLKKLQL